ncbi:MAG: hypothetical protein GDA49_13400 [Rhodospirillales bacterium]|nr:hypothetical protein [Rhodospirillales bacterium]
MFSLAKRATCATRAISAISDLCRNESGLVRTERTLLWAVVAMALATVLLLLGADIVGWFGLEPPRDDEA